MGFSPAERSAMRRALELAALPVDPPGPNPRVGCVLLDRRGRAVGEGRHLGAGTPHAEVSALAAAQGRAEGGTAVVTLEPCHHHGRTAPCTAALIEAGITRVVYAQRDPNPVAAGGAEALRAAGISVRGGLRGRRAATLNRIWSFAVTHGRPFVTWKFATTLDGRVAAADGSSRWVSSAAARADTHRLRAECDTILVGTNTVDVDDPALTVRDADDRPLPHQPLRAVMGLRELSPDRQVLHGDAETMLLTTRDPRQALALLHGRERRHVFLEGGPTLAAAFVRAGLVDEVVTYVAPMLLGAGRLAVGDLGIETIAAALRFDVSSAEVLHPLVEGDDVNVKLTMTLKGS